MVRYHEILNEEINIEEIERDLGDFVKIRGLKQKNINPITGSVDIIADTITVLDSFKNKFPVKFGKIMANFFAVDRDLRTLENGPTEVYGDYAISHNIKLATLEHAPKIITGRFVCHDNTSIVSLKGIELDSKIKIFEASNYDKSLPLLRLCVVATEVTLGIGVINSNGNIVYEEIDNIINFHIKTYPNIKERIIKCQYALIKAGYKENAKW